MKKPQPLPQIRELYLEIKEDIQKLLLLHKIKPTDYKGRYLHWDKLKYMPAPHELTAEEYWLGTKLARIPLMQEVAFQDNAHRPFQFGTPDVVQKMLHEVDKNAVGQIKMAEPVANSQMRDMYLIKSLIDEAINSSQLEGASTTRNVAQEMLRTERKPRNRSEQMILNNYVAMRFVREHKDDPLTPAFVFELHRLLTRQTLDDDTLAGQFRTNSDDILVVDVASEQILHTPPPAPELAERLEKLCAFANDTQSEQFIHPVVRAIMLHFMLAYDHPFVDGNGRTARALFYWSMANQGYWLIEFVSISKIIKNAPAKYGYAFMYTETDDNDLTYFIIHQLKVLTRAIERLHAYLARKMDEVKQTVALLAQTKLANQLNHRQTALLEHALKNPNTIYKIKEHQTVYGISYQTARTDFMKLADQFNLFHQLRDGRQLIYLSPIDLKERIEAYR